MSNYLFELGVEELPYKFISSAISQLKVAFEKLLNEYSLPFESVNVYATPRRLAVLVKNVALAQADSEKVIKGPIASIAYNPDGTFSKAALGFAAKNNVAEEFLYVQDNYLYAKVKTVGKSFEEILVSNISDVILKLQGPHFMRWSNHDEKFARPIRWIVSMLDNAHLPLTILDISSSDITRGHRFSENKTLKISSPDTYVEELKKANVFVNQDERRELIKTLVKSKADELSAEVDFDDDLLDEVTYICEYPAAVVCDFDEKYLDIPQEVAVTVMKVHQRYFPLYKNGKLINKFVTVTNFVGNDFENIKAGNLRVIKARLDDAVFFYNEDTKISLESYLEKLKGITFQKNMGSVFDKTQRIIKLSSFIAEKLNLDKKDILRTAELCKADLATSLVFEFTELQGYIGANYALVSKENSNVANGIKEHYFPLNAESELATSKEGQVVGIADKLDTICAVFASGKKPSGSSDPLGVRRAVLGIIKTVLEYDLKLDLSELIDIALKQLPVESDVSDKVKEFFMQRLYIYLGETYNKPVLEACSNVCPLKNLSDFILKVKVVSSITDLKLIESATRVTKILKTDVETSVSSNLFVFEEERNLYDAINKLPECRDYSKYASDLSSLNDSISSFFDKVLIMDKDEKIKQNRMALLKLLKSKYDILGDFSRL